MQTEDNRIRIALKDELGRLGSKNPRYSQRAFARDVGISVTSMNDFLAGRRELGPHNLRLVNAFLRRHPRCGWCDRPRSETRFLVGGPHRQFLCDTCIDAIQAVACGAGIPG